jgi:YidC/Oxa1 family membrane protein insertase
MPLLSALNPAHDLGGLILAPVYLAISSVLVGCYRMATDVLGLGVADGTAWALAIIGLTLVVRTALVPLFVIQVRSSRRVQLLAPQVKELRHKYGGDRERLAQETMRLYAESGTSPFSSCLPLLLQLPIFLALFRLLDQAATSRVGHGLLTERLATRFAEARMFGELPLSATFLDAVGVTGVRVLAAALVVLMAATTFFTQRQLVSRNLPADAMSGPYAVQQRMLVHVLPVVFAAGGIVFPIGVLLYWTASNLWTLGQQLYVVRNFPAPGTPAMQAKEARDRARRERRGLPHDRS